MYTPVKLALISSSLCLLAGCATTNDIDSLREQMATLQASVDEAKQASQSAESMASSNQSELADLRRDVDEARRLAADANVRVDEAFQTSQRK